MTRTTQLLLDLEEAARRTGAGGLLQDGRRQDEPATTGERDGMLPPGGKEIDPLPGGAQRRLGGELDRNPKLWCHVTQNVEIEGEQNSHWRDRRREPQRERAQPQDL